MSSSSKKIIVSIKEQILRFFLGDILVKEYPVSTSSYGIGSDYGSNKTPLGKHKIAAKIGDDLPLGTILINRKNTGRISNIYYDDQDRDTDSVLTRIMWLDGIETKNKNSKDRFIYIHGTPEEGLIGKTASHGCIRMKNRDVIELYDMVDTDTFVEIEEN
ncbi:MAG: L,D-transpeptidase [Candidatus Delongbacteria bacterium]|nr:L,D-transpeptidase [Candidatus Delongbacteria bacterium]MBN2833937.1 L,D-transpeptidase [Candidatus Delongbacteria bacterium]